MNCYDPLNMLSDPEARRPSHDGRELKRLLAVRLVPAHRRPSHDGRELKRGNVGNAVNRAVARHTTGVN